MEVLAGVLITFITLLIFLLGFAVGQRNIKEDKNPIMTFARKTKPRVKPIVRDDTKAFEIEQSR